MSALLLGLAIAFPIVLATEYLANRRIRQATARYAALRDAVETMIEHADRDGRGSSRILARRLRTLPGIRR